MHRERCGACAGMNLEVFLRLHDTPLANKYPQVIEREQFYPLELGLCGNCGLVQLMEIVPDAEIYNKDYGFYSGASATQRAYHARGAQLLMERFPKECQRGVLEIACNDGSLLRHFHDAGFPSLGIDPSSGPVAIAKAAGLNVISRALSTPLAQEIREEYGPAGLVIAYNTLAHVEDLTDVLTGVRTLMDDQSIAVVEMQYLPDLLVGNMYDQVYHEHRYFYSLTSFMHAAQLHGLYVVDAELIELQNGGLRVTLSTDRAYPVANCVYGILATEEWLSGEQGLCVYRGFQGQIDRTREHLVSIIHDARANGNRLAGYAAAAKATTIVSFCDLTSTDLTYIIDTTPWKQGRYLPGTGIPIISPDEAAERQEDSPIDAMLLLSSNYLGTVLRNNSHRGRWITPLPLPMVI